MKSQAKQGIEFGRSDCNSSFCSFLRVYKAVGGCGGYVQVAVNSEMRELTAIVLLLYFVIFLSNLQLKNFKTDVMNFIIRTKG
jgi:hypothetical protein